MVVPSTWEREAASLIYRASFRTAKATQRNPVLKIKVLGAEHSKQPKQSKIQSKILN